MKITTTLKATLDNQCGAAASTTLGTMLYELQMGDFYLEEGTAPVNGVASQGTLTFSDVVADGQTVTIGTDVYEFDTDASVTEGNILVDVSGGVTASAAVTALVAKITSDGDGTYSAVDGAGDTVVVTAATKGVAGDLIATTETCTNGEWDAVTLGTTTAGVDGTVGTENDIYRDDSYLYVCIGTQTIADNNWRRISIGSVY